MLDHALGRPSPTYRRVQVIITTLLSLYYLRSAPISPSSSILRRLNSLFKSVAAYKVILYTLLFNYVLKNLDLLLFLNPVDPLRKMYTRSFFRATYIMTAMDAAFFTSLGIPFKPLRHLSSVLLTVYYLIFPNAAQIKAKSFPNTISMMRTSWEKSTNPIFYLLSYPIRGYLQMRHDILIQRPAVPSPSLFKEKPAIKARLYFPYDQNALLKSTDVILDIPGGGFVCMEPRNHDDYLSSITRKTKRPVVAINYGKSPEHPYPWALEECFDVYRELVESNGKCVGMMGWEDAEGNKRDKIRIILMGDSAGGNLATGLIMKAIQQGISLPLALIMMYPCLSIEMACWMPEEHMKLIKGKMLKDKTELSMGYPLATTEAPRRIDVREDAGDESDTWFGPEDTSIKIHSGLSMTSRMSYFSDRIIQPEGIF